MDKNGISEDELKDRRRAVQNVLGTMNAEGELPSPEAIAIFERYASGEIGLDTVKTEIDQLVQNIIQRAAAAGKNG